MIIHKSIKTFSLLIIFSVLLVINASAQITSSPYSMFGMGNIEENSFGDTKAMGGTGIAFKSQNSVNFINPASYDGFDSLATVFELGIFGKYTSYNTTDTHQGLIDASVQYVAMGLKPVKKMATTFGISSYSTVGYNINSNTPIGSSVLTYDKALAGEGGVNQLFLGNSYEITKNLVFGINVVYLFGSISHSESSTDYTYLLKDVTYLSNINLNYGLNYQFGKKDWKYNIGLIYNNGKTLTTRNVQTITTVSGTETLDSNTDIYRIPKDYGIGLAIEKNYFRIGVDYEMKQWKDISYNNPLIETRNSNRFSLGVEIPSLGANRGTGKMFLYRFGFEYNESYLIIDKVPINYRAISFGAGIPVKGAISVINLSLELGQNGSELNGLFREDFCTLHLDISLKDHWFMKRKYD